MDPAHLCVYETTILVTLSGLQTIQYFGSILWNTLPLFVCVASSVSVFLSKLKTHFIISYL